MDKTQKRNLKKKKIRVIPLPPAQCYTEGFKPSQSSIKQGKRLHKHRHTAGQKPLTQDRHITHLRVEGKGVEGESGLVCGNKPKCVLEWDGTD